MSLPSNTVADSQSEVVAPSPPYTHVPPPPSTQLIECLCSDGVVVEVPANYLRVSRLFDDMCRNLQLGDENSVDGDIRFEGQFPVGPIRGEVMQKVAEWCEKHSGLPDPVVEYTELFERKRIIYTDWEHDFLSALSVDQLKEILMAANFLDLYSLFTYACQRGAELMENKSVEKVRAEWHLPDNLSAEEKEQIRGGANKNSATLPDMNQLRISTGVPAAISEVASSFFEAKMHQWPAQERDRADALEKEERARTDSFKKKLVESGKMHQWKKWIEKERAEAAAFRAEAAAYRAETAAYRAEAAALLARADACEKELAEKRNLDDAAVMKIKELKPELEHSRDWDDECTGSGGGQ